jgi:hypothetical protein
MFTFIDVEKIHRQVCTAGGWLDLAELLALEHVAFLDRDRQFQPLENLSTFSIGKDVSWVAGRDTSREGDFTVLILFLDGFTLASRCHMAKGRKHSSTCRRKS